MEEVWKNIEWLNGKYQVSNIGRVKSVKKGLIRKQIIGTTGYPCVSLYRSKITPGPKLFFKKVHRLVAEAFLPNPANLRVVNHKNGIKTDNTVDNLEWVSHKENISHSMLTLGNKQGTVGEGHPNAVLNAEKVQTIRNLHKQGHSQRKIASLVGAARRTIRNVLDGKQWTHV